MTDHATNVATITVQDILQKYGVSGIKSRQIVASIRDAGYAIVPAAELERLKAGQATRLDSERWVTCVTCEAHKPVNLMWREIAKSGWVCNVCAEEYR